MKFSTLLLLLGGACSASDHPYTIVDTAQAQYYDAQQTIDEPTVNESYFGQDAHYNGHAPNYQNNNDGTISDLITDLMWTREPKTQLTHAEALSGAKNCRIGGYTDWRLPTAKELYSLIQFNGIAPSPHQNNHENFTPFINNEFFKFKYTQANKARRIFETPYATRTLDIDTKHSIAPAYFGIDFANGQIKSYRLTDPNGKAETFSVLYVRGNINYGLNQFKDNLDGTITDTATGLTWMQNDSGQTMDWPAALKYAASMKLAGYNDWRLPNAKELHSLVDYTRSPDSSDSASIQSKFNATPIINEQGIKDYAYYWTSTSYIRPRHADRAVYIAFGRALSHVEDPLAGKEAWLNINGSGSQGSDLKSGAPEASPEGRGPRSNVIRVNNMVRLVRGGTATSSE
ncbi:DUF1566 domain-containing protein [Coraliomargarita sp. SDUM461004]|uniref:DUF1566 domain-containing protein n=1 Tax=Thalassobacterium sedimentorum TaxID=3041258 RepID=A0ABU1AMS1_9BACT|nr:DUF1566 domain-containing protein [Coraliomargarita sp. SDUM461004]MDQ8195066.1 DUF1566 domain-containing protein [Coraliomargarita sp. SDUM461004]